MWGACSDPYGGGVKTAAAVAQNLVRFCGVAELGLGLLFWSDHLQSLIVVHIVVGLVLVLALWTLAVLAALSRSSPFGQVVFAAVWGLLLPVFGLTQDQLLTGGAHWVVQVLHLLAGLIAIGLGEGLGGGIRRAAAPVPQAP
jgi:hypothetical protein